MSALPPKPPMPSRPVTKVNSHFVLARSAPLRSGPSFASRAISSVTMVSTCFESTRPGRAVAQMTKTRDHGWLDWKAAVSDASWLVVDERLVQPRRETVGEDGRGQIELGVTRLEVRRRVPAEIGALLRHAVAHFDGLLAIERRRPACRPVERRSRREWCRNISRPAAWPRRDRSRRQSPATGCWACSRSGRSRCTSSSVAAARSSCMPMTSLAYGWRDGNRFSATSLNHRP